MLILNKLRDDIDILKQFWEYQGKAEFIRIEGGLIRHPFISNGILQLMKESDNAPPEINPEGLIDPDQEIQWLPIGEEKINHLLYLYSLLQPGVALIIFDSDADIESHIGEPLIC